MKATIKKEIDIKGEGWLHLYANDKFAQSFFFDPEAKEEGYSSYKNCYERALKAAKFIESEGLSKPHEVIYETGKEIDPSLYFMAANMTDEEIQNTIGNDVTKLD